MKHVIGFLLFLAYTIVIFFIDRYDILLGVLLINITLMLAIRTNLKKAVKNLVSLMGFVVFTGVVNYLLTDISSAIMVTIKLMLVCNITYTFSKIVTPVKLANVIETLLSPLKILNIDTKDIGIMISVAITFIPILKHELQQLTLSLKAKGQKVTIQTMTIVLKAFFLRIMEKSNKLELSLRAKGFED